MDTTDHLSRIGAAIIDADTDLQRAVALPHRTDQDNAIRAVHLARVSARRMAWWGVLERVLRADPAVHWLHLSTATAARVEARNAVRFWRETSADWLARHEHRPTSDAAGSLSNWADLGVTA